MGGGGGGGNGFGDGAGLYDGVLVAVDDAFGRVDGREAAPEWGAVVGCEVVVLRGDGDGSAAGVGPPRVRKPGPSHAQTATAKVARHVATNKALKGALG